MRLLTVLLLALALLLSAGCLSAPGLGHKDPSQEGQSSGTTCKHADHNNSGTAVNGYYVADGRMWQETNGITGLQESRTCEGPADTDLS